jgi:uncharacterized protein
MKNLRWVILALVIAVCTSSVVAQIKLPELKQRVNDFTNTLGFQEWQEIDRLLKSYEDTISIQVVVLMINSLEGESIEDYANKTFALNKIGQAKKNNGVLVLIAKQDHKVRIEVGYDLEGTLTDAVSSQIIRNEILPHFKADNYFGGIVTGVDAIIRTTRGEYQADNRGKKAHMSIMGWISLATIFVMVLTSLTLQKALKLCSPESRTMNPRYVWLIFIPIFNFVWQFIVVLRVSSSLGNEFALRNLVKEPNPGRKIGLAWCIWSLGSFLCLLIGFMLMDIVIIGSLVITISIAGHFAGIVYLIIYLWKISRYSTEIAFPYRKG